MGKSQSKVDDRLNKTVRKAIIFTRVSTRRQEKEGLSLEKIQIPAAEKWAKDHNLEIVRVYAISETGGRYKQRTKFNKMIEFVENNDEITDIISFRVDRVTRNYRDAVAIDDLMEDYGITAHFVDDRLVLNKNSSANDISQWDTKVFIAKQQLERLREDGRNSKYAKLRAGELPWNAPYGYKNQKYTSIEERVVPIEPEATIAREIFEKYATGAYSYKTLAKEMNDRYGGLGQKFGKTMLSRMLHNPFFIGLIYDEETGELYPHIYKTLISKETFAKCGNVITYNGTSHHHSDGSAPSVYRGLIKCKGCGCDVIPDFRDKTQDNGNKHEYKYYHCTNAKEQHKHQHNITEEMIDGEVCNLLGRISLSEEQLQTLSEKLAEEHASKLDFYKEERKKLATRRTLIETRQRNIFDDMADRSISKEDYDSNIKRYQEELREIAEKENDLDGIDETIYVTMPYLREMMRSIVKIFNAGTIDEKREIVNTISDIITLDYDTLEITLKEPLLMYFS